MEEEAKKPESSEALLSAWMKTANDFWGSVARGWPESFPSAGTTATPEKEDGSSVRMKEAMDSILSGWRIFSSILGSPVFLETVSRGMHSLPETVSKLSRVAFEGYSNLQKQWLDRMGNIGKSTEAYKFEDLDQSPFKTWIQMYEKEFRPFYALPQLGLTRFYQERMAQAMDQFNLYQAAMNNFFHLLYLPMEKSNRVLQERLAALTEEGKMPENFQEYYLLWLKILEGHYMTLFKSPEFTQTLAETLQTAENFMEARQAVLQDLLQFLPIPSHKDMDDLYRDLYLLKKKVKELEKKLADSPMEKKTPKRKLEEPGGNGH